MDSARTQRYQAFISYSHSADDMFASMLEKALQQLARPWYKIRTMNVFRDGNNLSLSPDLWDGIVTALAESGYFVHLASPAAARSKWVGREIDYWLGNRDPRKLVIVVTEGAIEWDETSGDFDWSLTDCLHDNFNGRFSDEPFYLDMRWAKDADDLTLLNPRFKDAVALLSATIQEQAVEDVIGEEIQQHRRTMRIRNAAILSLSSLLLLASGFAWITVKQRDQALQTSIASRVSAELERNSIINAGNLMNSGYEQFGLTDTIKAALFDITSHPNASLAVANGPPLTNPAIEFSPGGDHYLSNSDLNESGDVVLRQLNGGIVRYLRQIYRAGFTADGKSMIVAAPSAPRLAGTDGDCFNDTGSGAVIELRREMLDGTAESDSWYDTDTDRARCPVPLWGDCPCGFMNPRQPSIVYAASGELYTESDATKTTIFDRQGILQATVTGPLQVLADEGNYLVTDGGSESSVLWDARGNHLATIPGKAAGLSNQGHVLTEKDNKTVLHKFSSAEMLEFDGGEPLFSPNGELFLNRSEKDSTKVWSIDGYLITELSATRGLFHNLHNLVMTTSPDGSIFLWDLARVPLHSIEAAESQWGISANQLRALFSTNYLEKSDKVKTANEILTLESAAVGITPGALPTYYAYVSRSELPANTVSKKEVRLGPGCELLSGVPERPGLSRFWYACVDGTFAIHDFEGELARWKHNDEITSVRFTNDGVHVLTGSADLTTRLWEIGQEESLAEYSPHESTVVKALFSPDLSMVGTVTAQGIARLWSRDGDLLTTITNQLDPIRNIAFADDNNYLLTQTENGHYRRYTIDPELILAELAWLNELRL